MDFYRHLAYCVSTGEIISAPSGNTLKRAVALTKYYDRKYGCETGSWRFCHDFGKNWRKNGYPTK